MHLLTFYSGAYFTNTHWSSCKISYDTLFLSQKVATWNYLFFTKLKFIMNHINTIWGLISYIFNVIFASYYLHNIPFSSYAFNLTLLWLSNNMTMMGCNHFTLISLSSESRYGNLYFHDISLYTTLYNLSWILTLPRTSSLEHHISLDLYWVLNFIYSFKYFTTSEHSSQYFFL